MTKFTTMENLAGTIDPCYGAVIKWNELVFTAGRNAKGGYYARIYEMVDLEDAPSEIEARLSKVKEATESFEDSGSAIKWCFKNA